MFNKYMTMYNSMHDYMPIVTVVLALFVVIGNIRLRMTLRQMHNQRKAIADARVKYARELAELRRMKNM